MDRRMLEFRSRCTRERGPAMLATTSGKTRAKLKISRSNPKSLRSYNRGNATILSHAAASAGAADGGPGFGADGHAFRDSWPRGHDPQSRGYDAMAGRTRGRGIRLASGRGAAVLQ